MRPTLLSGLLHGLFVIAKAALLFLACLFLFTTPSYGAETSGSAASVLGDTVSWALLAGVFTPLLTSLAQQPRWTGAVRVVVGIVISVVVAVLTLLANGSLNDGAQTVLSIVALVVVTSAASYKAIWQPSGVAPKLENATSKTPPAAPDPGDVPVANADPRNL